KMLHACELTSDVRRAEEWLELADRFCRTHYGGVLTAAGRWNDAERELVTSIEQYTRSYRALRAAAVVRLADLRVRQGRLVEAAELLGRGRTRQLCDPTAGRVAPGPRRARPRGGQDRALLPGAATNRTRRPGTAA